MPLRCIDELHRNVHAFDLSDEAWRSLAERNRRERHLRAPCCAAPVALKKSKLGTRFFAHLAKGGCITAPETESHLRLKQIAVEAARAQGWDATTEVSGLSPSGEPWRADVLAAKGNARVAVEIQWSSQTADETLRRQDRYRASGVRGLWLLQKSVVPVTPELPAAMIALDADYTFMATLSSGQKLPVDHLLRAAFAGRLKYGLPTGTAGTVSVRAAPMKCWHDACGADSIIITGVDLEFGPYRREFTVAAFSGEAELFAPIYGSLPSDLPVGPIKPRFSRTMDEEYLSNGCVRCDRLFGRFFEIDVRYEETVVSSFPVRASGRWRDFFLNGDDDGVGWAVFRVEELAV